LDQPTSTYLLSLLNETINDFSVASPFVYANAPHLNASLPRHQAQVHQFLATLQTSIAVKKQALQQQHEQQRQHYQEQLKQRTVMPDNLKTPVAANAEAHHRPSSAASLSIPLPATVSSPSLALLSETFPDAHIDVLEWVLNAKFFGDLQEASLYLMDVPDLPQLNQQRMAQQKKERLQQIKTDRERSKLREAERKQTLQRYTQEVLLPSQQVTTNYKYSSQKKGCRPVPNTHDGRRLTKVKKKIKGEQEVRYVDGKQIRVRKGTKKIVVENKTLPDWDGGSRGKTKSKGKRGVGFH